MSKMEEEFRKIRILYAKDFLSTFSKNISEICNEFRNSENDKDLRARTLVGLIAILQLHLDLLPEDWKKYLF